MITCLYAGQDKQITWVDTPPWLDHNLPFEAGPVGEKPDQFNWPYQQSTLPLLLSKEDFPFLIRQREQALSLIATPQDVKAAVPYDVMKIWLNEKTSPPTTSHPVPFRHRCIVLILTTAMGLLIITRLPIKFSMPLLLLGSLLFLLIPPYQDRLVIVHNDQTYTISYQPIKGQAAWHTLHSRKCYFQKNEINKNWNSTLPATTLPPWISSRVGNTSIQKQDHLWSTSYILKLK